MRQIFSFLEVNLDNEENLKNEDDLKNEDNSMMIILKGEVTL